MKAYVITQKFLKTCLPCSHKASFSQDHHKPQLPHYRLQTSYQLCRRYLLFDYAHSSCVINALSTLGTTSHMGPKAA